LILAAFARALLIINDQARSPHRKISSRKMESWLDI